VTSDLLFPRDVAPCRNGSWSSDKEDVSLSQFWSQFGGRWLDTSTFCYFPPAAPST